VQVEDKGSKVLRNSNRTGWNQDKERKDKRSVGLADFSRNQGYTEVFETS